MILPCATRHENGLDRRTWLEGEISTVWRTLYVQHSPSAVCSLKVSLSSSSLTTVMVRCPAWLSRPFVTFFRKLIDSSVSSSSGGRRWSVGLSAGCRVCERVDVVGWHKANYCSLSVCRSVDQSVVYMWSLYQLVCGYGSLLGSSDGLATCRLKITQCYKVSRGGFFRTGVLLQALMLKGNIIQEVHKTLRSGSYHYETRLYLPEKLSEVECADSKSFWTKGMCKVNKCYVITEAIIIFSSRMSSFYSYYKVLKGHLFARWPSALFAWATCVMKTQQCSTVVQLSVKTFQPGWTFAIISIW